MVLGTLVGLADELEDAPDQARYQTVAVGLVVERVLQPRRAAAKHGPRLSGRGLPERQDGRVDAVEARGDGRLADGGEHVRLARPAAEHRVEGEGLRLPRVAPVRERHRVVRDEHARPPAGRNWSHAAHDPYAIPVFHGRRPLLAARTRFRSCVYA